MVKSATPPSRSLPNLHTTSIDKTPRKTRSASAAAAGSYPTPIAISMSGCGFLCSYHIGSMTCFSRHAKGLLANVSMYCGASAGALIATLMVLAPDSLQDALNKVYILANEVPTFYKYPFDRTFNMAQRLADIVDEHIPENVSAANGRLVVSLTRKKDYSNRLISNFPSRNYLLQCLNATCYIPYYSRNAIPPKIDNQLYIDGGYSNNLPMVSGMHTITISPFCGNAKISPRNESRLNFGRRITFGQQQLNVTYDNIARVVQALFPGNRELIDHYFELGYRDTMRYLLKRGYYERSEGTEI